MFTGILTETDTHKQKKLNPLENYLSNSLTLLYKTCFLSALKSVNLCWVRDKLMVLIKVKSR